MNVLRAPGGAAVILAVTVLAACTSTNGSGSTRHSPGNTSAAAPSSAGTRATSASSAVGSSAASSGSAGETSSGAPGPAHRDWCSAAQLSVAGGPLPGGSAAGHTGVLLTFTNHSSTRCVLLGYPGVAGLDASGSQIAQASRTFNGYLAGCRCGSILAIPLVPGAVASAVTEGHVGSGNCDTFTALLVTPPNTATSTRVDLVPHSCGFTVHPVVAGSTGSA